MFDVNDRTIYRIFENFDVVGGIIVQVEEVVITFANLYINITIGCTFLHH